MCFGSSRVIISSDAATLHTGGKAAVAANVGDRHLRLERAWFAWLSKTDQLLNFLQHFQLLHLLRPQLHQLRQGYLVQVLLLRQEPDS